MSETSLQTSGGDSLGEDGSGVSREQVFDILSNRRRRHTLHYLRQHDRPVELRELSTQLTAWENGTTLEEVTHDERKRLYTALRQIHLPKMDNAGVLDFDAARGVIESKPAMEDVEIYLDVVPAREIPRSEFYLGLSAIAVALTVSVWVDLPPFGALPDTAWMALVAALFFLSAAVDVYYDAKRRIGSDNSPPDVLKE